MLLDLLYSKDYRNLLFYLYVFPLKAVNWEVYKITMEVKNANFIAIEV